jgi:hypothetical protein
MEKQYPIHTLNPDDQFGCKSTTEDPPQEQSRNPRRQRSRELLNIGILRVSDFDDALVPFPSPIAELAADPEAARWARDCAWVPGTGHCRNRPCAMACLFRAQRAAEAGRILRWRRTRRPPRPGFSGRIVPRR